MSSKAIGTYHSKCRSRDIRPPTLSKYKTLTNQIEAYCNGQGYLYIDQLSAEEMDKFYGSWKDGKKGKAKKLERLKSFVRFCRKRKWLAEDITEDLQAPPKASALNQKAPFDDEELEWIYATCVKFGYRPPPSQRLSASPSSLNYKFIQDGCGKGS